MWARLLPKLLKNPIQICRKCRSFIRQVSVAAYPRYTGAALGFGSTLLAGSLFNLKTPSSAEPTKQSVLKDVDWSREDTEKLTNVELERFVTVFVFLRADQYNAKLEGYKHVGKQFEGKVNFDYVNIEEDEASAMFLQTFNLRPEECPAVAMVVVKGSQITKYKLESSTCNEKTVVKFVEDFLNNKLKPYHLSQDIPKDWNSGSVKVLVGKNFNQVARNKDKAVFVEFYTPQCPVCKRVDPVLEELGLKYKDRDDVIIAKMDSWANDVEGMSFEGYPTFVYFPKGSDEMIQYRGRLTLEEFSAFVDSEGKQNPYMEEATLKTSEEQMMLSPSYRIKSASSVVVDSAITLLSQATIALLEAEKKYTEALSTLCILMDYKLQVLDNETETARIWDLILEGRALVQKTKEKKKEMEFLMDCVKRLIDNAGEVAFMAGAEYSGMSSSERLQSTEFQLNQLRTERAKAETFLQEMEVKTIEVETKHAEEKEKKEKERLSRETKSEEGKQEAGNEKSE